MGQGEWETPVGSARVARAEKSVGVHEENVRIEEQDEDAAADKRW